MGVRHTSRYLGTGLLRTTWTVSHLGLSDFERPRALAMSGPSWSAWSRVRQSMTNYLSSQSSMNSRALPEERFQSVLRFRPHDPTRRPRDCQEGLERDGGLRRGGRSL